MSQKFARLLQAAREVVNAETDDAERSAITRLGNVIKDISNPKFERPGNTQKTGTFSPKTGLPIGTGPCAVCGKDAPPDLGSGGPYRCHSDDCVMF